MRQRLINGEMPKACFICMQWLQDHSFDMSVLQDRIRAIRARRLAMADRRVKEEPTGVKRERDDVKGGKSWKSKESRSRE